MPRLEDIFDTLLTNAGAAGNSLRRRVLMMEEDDTPKAMLLRDLYAAQGLIDIRAFMDSVPSVVGHAEINAAISELAAGNGGTLYLPPGLVYEIGSTIILKPKVYLRGAMPFGWRDPSGANFGTVIRLATGANCRMMAAESSTCHIFGVSDMILHGNAAGQAADDGSKNTGINLDTYADYNGRDFIGLHLGLHAGTATMTALMGSSDHFAAFENLYLREIAGSGLVVEAARESYFNNLMTFDVRRFGYWLSTVDSRWSNIVAGPSDWCGMMFGASGGTSRVTNCKSWFSGRRGRDHFDAYKTACATGGTGLQQMSSGDITNMPWGINLGIRTAGSIFTGMQTQDSDGHEVWVNGANGSTIEVTTDSPANIYAASAGNSGGYMNGTTKTAPTATGRRHVVIQSCDNTDITVGLRTRTGATLVDYMLQLAGVNTNCRISGRHDFKATVGEITGTIDPSMRIDLPMTRHLIPHVSTADLQSAAHYVNTPWTPGGGTRGYKRDHARAYNTTLREDCVAQGGLATSTWVSERTGTVLTPV